MSGIPGVFYSRVSPTRYEAPGREALTQSVDRSILGTPLMPYGSYLPCNPDYAGLLPGWTPNMLTQGPLPGVSTGGISLTTPNVTYQNMIFWGEVKIQAPGIKFINCAFAGRYATLYTQLTGLIKCYGAGYYQFEAEDCLFAPDLWQDPTLTKPSNGSYPILNTTRIRRLWANTTAIHGGRFTLKRAEIRTVQDGINWVQGVTSPEYQDSFTLMEGCWVHDMTYWWGRTTDAYFDANGNEVASPSSPGYAYTIPGWTATEDGSHSDAFQTNTGHNLTLRGNYFGGVRDEVGYKTYDPTTNPLAFSYNSGHDAWNALNMLKQETSDAADVRIYNVLIEKNFYEGGFFCINMPYISTRPSSWLGSTQIKDNFFVRRALPPNFTNGGYVARHVNYAGLFSNNRIIDLDGNGGFTVGELVPYTNG